MIALNLTPLHKLKLSSFFLIDFMRSCIKMGVFYFMNEITFGSQHISDNVIPFMLHSNNSNSLFYLSIVNFHYFIRPVW